ncbi:NifU family protein [Mesorhizobium escarrei]|uniref:NifU family protein n=1 Tax=Mesorhizobium escarrei TaxID=666018 RepID=A0ABN8KCW1_9HYPH|nr:NifU family protein [Mesorhizobium escarrei]CAH2408092.1 NifU family protein [Mesorhizobium escarrei]
MTAGGPPISADGLERALACIRPLVLGHGGNIEIVDVDNGVVTVELTGACEACPNIAMTYAGSIRTFLMEVPGVMDVKCRRMHASERTLDRIAHMLGARPFE